LQRVLSNFVSNAVRYTERGGVLLGCRRRGPNLQIAVWDTGCGIPEDRREDIFCEFVQLDSRDRDRGKGLGLGLAIVARLAPLLGSRVELRSEPGRGSMFAIGVPLAEAQDERKAAASLATTSGRTATLQACLRRRRRRRSRARWDAGFAR
jgi:signal transduction histidine kinase